MDKIRNAIEDRREKKKKPSGVQSRGGKISPLSFVSDMKNGKRVVLGTNRTLLLTMTDEEKKEMKRSCNKSYSEDYLDARAELEFKYKKTYTVENREFKRPDKTYFNRKVFSILLKATNHSEAIRIASDEKLCKKYIEILENKVISKNEKNVD